MNWTLSKKMITGFIGIFILAVIFAVFVSNQMGHMERGVAEYSAAQEELNLALEMRYNASHLGELIHDAALMKNRGTMEKEAKQTLDEVYRHIAALTDKNKDNTEVLRRLEALKEITGAYWDIGNSLFAAHLGGTEKTDVLMEKFDQAGSEFSKNVEAILNSHIAEAKAVHTDMIKDIAFSGVITKIGIAIFLVLIVFFAFILVRAFGYMSKDVVYGINVLASSSNQIITATTQLAAGAVETATASTQTASSVEEVKQVTHLANQKAKYVAETAKNTAQISSEGKIAVEKSIADMSTIKEQMMSVGASIQRLSEQSRTIGEIIVAVNSIADQSNLLAVNAAIEAAKAGEQGKGFAVVAQEIKYLAEQSKQSTGQVRVILDDIQKAITAVSLASEKGSRVVELSVERSGQTGEIIGKLSDSITESEQAAVQIAASAQQQIAGMDQVAVAMDNIKTATEQNAASTKQVEAAAKSLHELGEKLKVLAAQI